MGLGNDISGFKIDVILDIYVQFQRGYTGMFEIQGRLKTIRKEAIRKWGTNPSNA